MADLKINTLCTWLRTNGISQEALARQCDISTPHLNQVLNGHQPNISVELLVGIVDATGLDMDTVARELVKAIQQRRNEEDALKKAV